MEKQSAIANFIIVTGAESTGKTQLSKALAEHYKCAWVSEMARDYIEQLNRPYTYADIEHIAQYQIEAINQAINNPKKVIFDTGLIITKVWFEVVYGNCPKQVTNTIEKMPRVFHLLCDADIPWVPDTVRENGGEMRKILQKRYETELNSYNFPYAIVNGQGNDRLNNAIEILNNKGF